MIKSQDDIKHQDTRSSDVLIKAVEKCEKLEKQLKLAVECLEIYASPEYKMVGMSNGVPCTFIISNTNNLAQKTLEQIKELDNEPKNK